MRRFAYETSGRVFPAGTLLTVRVRGMIDHVGIATGYGTVIHSSMRHGRVLETDMNEFSGGRPIRMMTYSSPLSGTEVVVRARGRINQRYNPLTRNCQHFVTWCISGEARSQQLGVFDIRRFL